jgi:hypothetical protein
MREFGRREVATDAFRVLMEQNGLNPTNAVLIASGADQIIAQIRRIEERGGCVLSDEAEMQMRSDLAKMESPELHFCDGVIITHDHAESGIVTELEYTR